jgi:hypothetical protein
MSADVDEATVYAVIDRLRAGLVFSTGGSEAGDREWSLDVSCRDSLFAVEVRAIRLLA